MRVTKGTARTKAKKKVMKQAKGFRGGRSKLYRTAKEAVVRSQVYAYRDRRAKKRDFRRLWITRLSAALHNKDVKYSRFIDALAKANIRLNRKILSELAISEKEVFDRLVDEVMAENLAAK